MLAPSARAAWLLFAAGAALSSPAGCGSCGKAAPSASSSPAAPSSTEAPSAAPSHPPPRPAPVRQGSVVSLAPGGDVLYVADEDASVLHVVPLPLAADRPARAVALPGRPAQVLALDGEILVTIRDPGLLLVLRPDAAAGLVEAARVELPADAWGIAVTGDEKTAIVSSAWTHRVSGVDLAARKVRFSVDVAREPRGIAVLAGGSRAYVSHLIGSALTRIDGLGGDEPAVTRVAFPAAPLRALRGSEEASLGYALLLSADERRLYAARHALDAETLEQGRWAGAPTVDVLLTGNDAPLAPPQLADAGTSIKSLDPEMEMPLRALPVTEAFAPRALAWRPREGALLLLGEGNPVLFEIEPHALEPSSVQRRSYPLAGCGAPSGVAVSADDRAAYVFCRSTDQLAVVTFATPGGGPDAGDDVSVTPLGAGPADAQVAEGRRLFYSATDSVLTDAMSCASCHPDGRDDGHTWHVDNGPGLPTRTFWANMGTELRQTPMLAGRVAAAGPYGWRAESKTLVDRIWRGFDLHRRGVWVYPTEGDDAPGPVLPPPPQARALAAFVRAGLVPPPRPAGELSDVQKRGKALFESAAVGCTKCHTGAEHTDRARNPLGDDSSWESDNEGYRTPSLLYVGGTPPYFHDGRAATLEDLVENNGDRMGKTQQLDPADRAALIAYLRTL